MKKALTIIYDIKGSFFTLLSYVVIEFSLPPFQIFFDRHSFPMEHLRFRPRNSTSQTRQLRCTRVLYYIQSYRSSASFYSWSNDIVLDTFFSFPFVFRTIKRKSINKIKNTKKKNIFDFLTIQRYDITRKHFPRLSTSSRYICSLSRFTRIAQQWNCNRRKWDYIKD